ncbi:hypothetical protein N7509_006257 [Penicillium cosmopolitanum]|uniref:Uncharacterized protein n=1 Tax=Penicillium cosmopolitanum TaxID=1131564 RepID=A0A9W9W3P6_9EURO|nr:uncharacterized protein N7509_006257 [Penicillium cosmopolitanum]KAJ5398144.1 hypothetical protein N7509_006257 [Penicillium cosmopolitanum]
MCLSICSFHFTLSEGFPGPLRYRHSQDDGVCAIVLAVLNGYEYCRFTPQCSSYAARNYR